MQAKVVSSSGEIFNSRAQIMGYNIAASASIAIVQIRKTNSSGAVILRFEVPANESREVVWPYGVSIDDDVYVEIVSGSPDHVAIFVE